MANVSKTIKSKERVRDLAEVFTSDKEVNAMLELVKYLSDVIENTLLEPSCGNGNFLIVILKRKLERIWEIYKEKNNKNKLIKSPIDIDFYVIKAVASIYGIDISEENVLEARKRMSDEIVNFYSTKLNTKKVNKELLDSVNWVLEKNIIIGDMLNKVREIVLVEYTTPKKYYFKRQEFELVDQLKVKNKKETNTLFEIKNILKNYKISHYLKLCY